MRNAAEHLKVVCALGLPPMQAILHVSEDLCGLVAADTVQVGLFDEARLAWSGCTENVLTQATLLQADITDDPTCAAPSLNRRGSGKRAFSQWLDFGTSLHDSRYRSAHWTLEVVADDGTGPAAGILLRRFRDRRPFTRDDVLRLRSLLPHIAQALRPPLGSSIAQDHRTGFVIRSSSAIVQADGSVTHATPGFAQFCAIVENRQWSQQRRELRSSRSLPQALVSVLRRLPRGEGVTDVEPQRLLLDTLWGRMCIEAETVLPGGGASGLVRDLAVMPALLKVELIEHPASSVARSLRMAGATPSQVAVGVRLAFGQSKVEIALKLGVRRSSVEDAARKLYGQLNVHGAAELASRIWTGAQGGSLLKPCPLQQTTKPLPSISSPYPS